METYNHRTIKCIDTSVKRTPQEFLADLISANEVAIKKKQFKGQN